MVAYDVENDAITVEFTNGAKYLYDYASTGRDHVENMKVLAAAGQGLSSYISKFVKQRYAVQLS